MAVSLPPSSSTLFTTSKFARSSVSIRLPLNLVSTLRRSVPRVYTSISNASSTLGANLSTELDVVSSFSEIIPDTIIFDDFERFPSTAATISSSLLLGIFSLPDTKFKSAIETALADGECYEQQNPSDRLSCFYDKAIVNVGADLVKLVPGRVSTEVDAPLAYDTHGIVRKASFVFQILSWSMPNRMVVALLASWGQFCCSFQANGFITRIPQMANSLISL